MKEKLIQVGTMVFAVVIGIALVEYAIKPGVEKLKSKKAATPSK